MKLGNLTEGVRLNENELEKGSNAITSRRRNGKLILRKMMSWHEVAKR